MSKERLKFLICLLVIVIFVAVFGYLFEAWTGFPKGADAYARITRIVYILDFFPNIFWQYHWANGMPTFQSEAPLFYFLGAILAKFFFLLPEKPLIILGFLTHVLIGIGVFGYVRALTKSYTASLLAAILALSSFTVWSWMMAGGIYPRIFGLSLSLIALWRIVVFLQSVENSPTFPRGKFVWAVLALAAAMTAHALMSFFAWIAIFFIILTSPLPFKSKIKNGFLIYFVSTLLAGFFFFPMIFGFSGGGSTNFLGVPSPISPAPLYYLYHFDGMGPFILPILGIVFLLALVLGRSKFEEGHGILRIIIAPFLMLVFFAAYSYIGYTEFPQKYYYINGFIPMSAVSIMAVYASILIGLLFGSLVRSSKRVFPIIGIIVISFVVAVSILWVGPKVKEDRLGNNVKDTGAPDSNASQFSRILQFPKEGDFNHRFAGLEADEAIWFNVKYQIPQVRDYYGQGILYPDWRYWFEQAIWDPKKFSIDEAKMALDWFAVRWMSFYENNDIFYKRKADGHGHDLKQLSTEEFLNKSKNRYLYEPGFKLVNHSQIAVEGLKQEVEEVEVENPSPILSATNTPTVLFIGVPRDYYLLFTGLTFGNYSSSKIIPVRGKKYVDDYNLSELKKYNTLMLFSYQYHDEQNTSKLLTDYLNQGGNMIVESSSSPNISSVTPFSATQKSQIEGGVWNFAKSSNPLAEGINLDAFSAPLYDGTPWKIVTGKTDSLNSWAQVVLSSGDNPILVEGSIGNGKVVWSGFNFLYHIVANKNLEEAKLLYKIFDSMAKPGPKVLSQATFVNPQKRELQIQNEASGVLFKESYFPNWGAYFVGQDAKKESLKVNLAGPGMMYASLPKGSYPAKVVFGYHLSLLEKASFVISLLTLIGLLGFGLRIGYFEKMTAKMGSKSMPVLKKTFGWWDDEEK